MENTDNEKKKAIEETKTKIIWELTNKENIECILFGDGNIHGAVGNSDKIMNALSNMIMSLLQSGIPKHAIKRAIKTGLNWERYVTTDE